MGTIELRFFSTLQDIMHEKGFAFPTYLEVGQGLTVRELLHHLGIDAQEVEAVMVNGKVENSEKFICAGDRVALIPPGTPGPYRVMLGIKGKLDSKARA
ncbi:MAG: MoaD/ThiS family protein [Firmicutes bacterium]|nr:MoaD/ThiS family protein [Dethiobacter sp.]MBS3889607.1 MoaD/ThiS family protein [Bacillota bacterium]MBS4054094.1 MoaD/ThiS family protein [Thermaerobacter sp.]